MLRVVGTDPGTSSLDLLLLEDETVADQIRLSPAEFEADPGRLGSILSEWSPLDLVAAPSGYGLPLVRGESFTEGRLEEISLIRRDDRAQASGVIGFRDWVRAFVRSGVPLVFLPGGFHLSTIPAHRKVNAIDLGTPDKVAVVALALWFDAKISGGFDRSRFALIEIGSAFSAIMVVAEGKLVDAAAGTRGPIGLRCGGGWDGELAYLWSPLRKQDLFRGGIGDLGPLGRAAFAESITKHLAGLHAVTGFERIYLSGRGLEDLELKEVVTNAAARFGVPASLPSLRNAWVKHAAQGAGIVANAIAGGAFAKVAESLQLRAASGSVWDIGERWERR